MSLSRFFINETISSGCEKQLPADVSHHLKNVLRKQQGEHVILFNGLGGEYEAEIIHLAKKDVHVHIIEFRDIERESPLDITLAQGISKGQRMDFTIQKAVELGVHKIAPILNQRSNIQLKDDRKENRLKHWQQVIISACEQSGRNTIPELFMPMSVSEWLEQDTNSRKLVLAPEGQTRLSSLKGTHEKTSILIGSEGGLSQDEINRAIDKGCLSVQMGPRIFRTETAALVVLSACQSLWGDLK